MDDERDGGYKVGYKKPPKNRQFKKGESGNPQGRPKGKRNFKTELREELDKKITITEGGKTMLVTISTAIAKSLVAIGLKPNLNAIKLITQLDQESDIESAGSQENPGRFAEQQEIFERLIEKRAKRIIKQNQEEKP